MLKDLMVIVAHIAPPFEYKAEDGFTLLETLIALAILSIVSLALFQSTSTLLSVSDRAIKSGERTLDGALNRLAFARVIDGILPHWNGQEETGFRGNGTEIRGISTENLNVDKTGLSPFSIQITQTGQEPSLERSSMIYATDTVSWPLDIDLPNTARFYYLGRDQKWYGEWPTDEMPKAAFAIEKTYSDPQLIPLALSVQAPNGEMFWMAKIDHNRHLPPRFELLYNSSTN